MGKKRIEAIVEEVMSDTIEVVENNSAIEEKQDNNTNDIDVVVETITMMEEIENTIDEEPVFEDDVLTTSAVFNKEPKYKTGDKVKIMPNAKFIFGGNIPSELIRNGAYVKKVQSNGYAISGTATSRSIGIIAEQYLTDYVADEMAVKKFDAYAAMTVENNVKIQSKPYVNSNVLDTVNKDRLFIIVDEHKDWAHLQSGGWVLLSQLRRIF